MRYPAHETAEKHRQILFAAGQLFRERGVPGVSVAQIMTAIGLTHGPFYNHFASKQDLVVQSIAAASESGVSDLLALPPTMEARSAYIDGYLSRAHCDAPGQGCLMASLAADVARDPVAKPAFTAHLQTMISRFSTHFPWRRQERARAEAIYTLAAMVGGVVLARASADPALADEILAEVKAHIAAIQS